MPDFLATSDTLPTYIYQPAQNGPAENLVTVYEETSLSGNPFAIEDELESKSKAPVKGKSPNEQRAEVLAIMKAALLQSISQTCVSLIEHSRERLKRQYEMAQEEMEAIQKKNA